ncbi:hypothetical protein U9M48_033082 [Paspalum notatum var. saurae]|uniref:GPI-anchored protein LLG1-like domain-containing protein n=1 Tax=Paspalum notatum var. saurae TaxID=547442 RepID=A0AAQ3X6B5_PASNO
MGSSRTAAILFCCVALTSMVAVGRSAATEDATKFISLGALECSSNITKSSSRKLIAARVQVCPVRFDQMDMSAVVSSCRGRPSAVRCCGALKDVACPYSDLINDNENNGCASEMFYQIIVRGRLQPGLFSHLCREGPLGLQC